MLGLRVGGGEGGIGGAGWYLGVRMVRQLRLVTLHSSASLPSDAVLMACPSCTSVRQVCGTRNPKPPKASAALDLAAVVGGPSGGATAPADAVWSCPCCTYINPPIVAVCEICQTLNPNPPSQSTSGGQATCTVEGVWIWVWGVGCGV